VSASTTHAAGGELARFVAGLVVCLAGSALGPGLRAQVPLPEPEDNEAEVFAEMDPYAEREDWPRLSYVRQGSFALPGPATTEEVAEVLGSVPILWVETEHFKLGSTLKTYRLQGDQQERDKLDAELAVLSKGLGRLKAPRNELDPWLRLHLNAQRLESLYAEFVGSMGLEGADLGPDPFLGQKEKFLVLLLEKSASLARYTRRYAASEQTFSYRFGFSGGGNVFTLSAEGLRQNGYTLDAVLHSAIAFGVVNNFCDGVRASWGAVPVWFKYGLGHSFSRRVDARWSFYEGLDQHIDQREDAWRWEPRVRGLVENEVFPSFAQMLAWKDWSELDQRAHMMCWSRVEFLLARKGAQPKLFLLGVTEPPPEGQSEISQELRQQRQAAAFAAAFGGAPEVLEAEWCKYVKRNYPRK
jgi:hypothetical protein